MQSRTALVAFVLLGCASDNGGTPPVSPPLEPAAGTFEVEPPERCPMLPGVGVASYPVPDGILLVFRTQGVPSDELERRVRSFAERYSDPTRTDGAVLAEIDQRAVPLATSAEVGRRPMGLQVAIFAAYDEQVDALRDHVRHRVAAMQRSRKCPAGSW